MKKASTILKRKAVDLGLKSKLFRGLGDPSRLAIIDLLRDGPKCVYEIADSARLSQPNTSAHLACLGECGLVQRERRGKFIYYRVPYKEVTALLKEADTILARVGDQIFQCTRYERDGKRHDTATSTENRSATRPPPRPKVMRQESENNRRAKLAADGTRRRGVQAGVA